MFTVRCTLNKHYRATWQTATSVFWLKTFFRRFNVILSQHRWHRVWPFTPFRWDVSLIPPLIMPAGRSEVCASEAFLQFSQALLQALHVSVPVFALAAAGAALDELHLHGQLAELKVLAFFPQIHAAAHRAVLRAQGRGACHSQGVPTRNKRWDTEALWWFNPKLKCLSVRHWIPDSQAVNTSFEAQCEQSSETVLLKLFIPCQKISDSASTTIMTGVKIQQWRPSLFSCEQFTQEKFNNQDAPDLHFSS